MRMRTSTNLFRKNRRRLDEAKVYRSLLLARFPPSTSSENRVSERPPIAFQATRFRPAGTGEDSGDGERNRLRGESETDGAGGRLW